MKKLLNALLMASALMGMMTPAFAAEEQLNSENAARALALARAHEVRILGSFSYNNRLPNGTDVPYNGTFTLDSYGKIRDLVVNDVPIGSGEVPTLPFPKVGRALSFNVYVRGESIGGNTLWHGSYYSQSLNPGEIITIEASAYYRQKLVKISLPAGVDPDKLEIQAGNNGGGYNHAKDAYNISIGPWEESLEYKIYDPSTGIVYGTGILKPFEDAVSNTASAPLNMVFKGATEIGGLPANSWLPRQVFDATDRTSDAAQEVPAKFYFGKVRFENQQINVGSMDPFEVSVEIATESGDMPVVAVQKSIAQSGGGKGKPAGGGQGYSTLSTSKSVTAVPVPVNTFHTVDMRDLSLQPGTPIVVTVRSLVSKKAPANFTLSYWESNW